jgi:two-component sensor histidine kinase/CheY-like chemotaxis protein
MGGPLIRILLIEDNSRDAQLIEDSLTELNANQFNISHAVTLGDGLIRLSRERLDAVLLDLSLPDAHGLETVTRIQANSPEIPIVVITGNDDQALAIQAVQQGAQDYLIKAQAHAQVLTRAIRYAIERKRAEEQIKASLREKEVLLKEIHHRVKNNLQIIDSLLRLQADLVTNPQVVGLFQESHARVRTIGLLYETLCQSQNLADVDMPTYIDSLTRALFQTYAVARETIRLKLSIEPVSMSIDTAIPCGLIINELVSNSLKHAFPRGTGDVSVELVPNPPQTFTLVVTDTGVGLPREVDERNPHTLGLQLIAMLVDQLSGKSDLYRNGGTRWTVTFPQLIYRARF